MAPMASLVSALTDQISDRDVVRRNGRHGSSGAGQARSSEENWDEQDA